MAFDEVLAQVIDLLQREGRLSYRALKMRFALSDDHIEAIKDEIIEAKQLGRDEGGRILVWGRASPIAPAPSPATIDAPNSVSSPSPVKSESPSDTLDGERRYVTVLFADVSGFTALSETMDPEDIRDLMNGCFAQLIPIVEKYEGNIDKFIGDELMVLFGAPVAHENDAERAVRTGMEMMEALAAFDSKKGISLSLHCGINTGFVVAGGVGSGTRQDYSVMGDAVNLAARLRDASKKSQIFIGPETYRLTKALFTCEPTEPFLVKGKAELVQAYHVLKLREDLRDLNSTARGVKTPLIGRDNELAMLFQQWNQVKNGEGQVVLLSGEAGVGKSRMLQSLREHVATDTPTRLECRCSPYHANSAFYPIIDLLAYNLRFATGDSPGKKLKRLERALSRYHLDIKEAVPLLATLLSVPFSNGDYAPLALSPQMQRQKLMDVLLTFLLKMASQRLILFVVEDLHWIDPSTVALLTSLVKHGPSARIYTVFTARPSFISPWTNALDLAQINLTRIPHHQVEEIIKGVTGGKALPSDVVKQIVSKTDGVPLFVEELTRMVLESGHLLDQGDRYELVGSLSTLAIPATLQASLMARLDRLGKGKTVAQVGATIGRQFSYEIIHAVSNLNEGILQNALIQLVEAQLLFQHGVYPTRYTFKHALVQDTAYQSLLKSVRSNYHKRIASVLIERFPEITENQPERLAQHFSEAGLPSDAIDWWLRAGVRALQKSANIEAIKHLDSALHLLADLPDDPGNRSRELTLQMALGPALCATRGYAAPEVEQAFSRANALCRNMDNAPQLFPIQWGLWAFYVVRAAFDKAWDMAQTMLLMAETKGDANLLLEAHFSVGLTLYFQGRPVEALSHLRKVIEMDSPERDRSLTAQTGQDAGVCGLVYAGLTLWQLGCIDEALERSREGVALARRIKHPFSLAYALNFASWLRQMCHNVQEAKALSQEEIDLSVQQGFFWVTLGLIIGGWVEAEQGRIEEGITMIDQGLGGFRGAGARLSQTYQLAILAEILLRAKRAEEGLLLTDEALGLMDKTGERFWEGEMHRLRGLLLLALSPPRRDEARTSLQKAVEMARRQQAPMGILRAATSLARIAVNANEQGDARVLLAEILPVFANTKVDLPDLCEARTLFVELEKLASH
jgi:class 3 adenylate cyclase/predicted ATPase